MRTPEELERSGLAVLDLAFRTPAVYTSARTSPPTIRHKYPTTLAPLFSGGHDSVCACWLASRHPRFDGRVYHIDTHIGAKAAREHVEATARQLGWKLVVLKAPQDFEHFVREHGFPGPAMHRWTYVKLKERCVRMIVRRKRVALVTGARSEESTRRMGHTVPVRVGEQRMRNGREITDNMNRWWVAPCHDWTAEEQAAFMDEHDLPRNPLKLRLGLSGECFCGAFAAPGELERVRQWAPDVAAEIDRLAEIARSCGKHAVWGTRPPGRGKKGIAVVETGPLCVGCDRKAAAAGVVFTDLTPPPE